MRNAEKMLTRWYFDEASTIAGALRQRLGHSPDLEDLAQEVYLRLMRVNRPELIKDPRSYIYRVALNVAEEWRLRAPQARSHSAEALTRLEAVDDPEESASRREGHVAMRRAIESLPPMTRDAILLHVTKGMTYEQVAEHMDVSRRAIKRYIANGYAALRIAVEGPAQAGGDRS